jgi:hypothetical protein
MREYRRYEILLPRRFNDGNPVPPGLLRQTFRDLETRFGAVSAERAKLFSAHDVTVRRPITMSS